jgi:hypothetical protein
MEKNPGTWAVIATLACDFYTSSGRYILSQVWATLDGILDNWIYWPLTDRKFKQLQQSHWVTPNITVTRAPINSSLSSQDVSWKRVLNLSAYVRTVLRISVNSSNWTLCSLCTAYNSSARTTVGNTVSGNTSIIACWFFLLWRRVCLRELPSNGLSRCRCLVTALHGTISSLNSWVLFYDCSQWITNTVLCRFRINSYFMFSLQLLQHDFSSTHRM